MILTLITPLLPILEGYFVQELFPSFPPIFCLHCYRDWGRIKPDGEVKETKLLGREGCFGWEFSKWTALMLLDFSSFDSVDLSFLPETLPGRTVECHSYIQQLHRTPSEIWCSYLTEPECEPSSLHVFSHFILPSILWDRYNNCPNLKTEKQAQ